MVKINFLKTKNSRNNYNHAENPILLLLKDIKTLDKKTTMQTISYTKFSNSYCTLDKNTTKFIQLLSSKQKFLSKSEITSLL